MKNDDQTKITDLIRINSIVDMPSSIEDMFNLTNEKILAVARADNSIEIWNTITWIQYLRIPGLKSEIFFNFISKNNLLKLNNRQ